MIVNLKLHLKMSRQEKDTGFNVNAFGQAMNARSMLNFGGQEEFLVAYFFFLTLLSELTWCLSRKLIAPIS